MKISTDKIIFAVIGVITVGIFIFIISTSFSKTSTVDPASLIGENPHYKGAENPTVTIVEFSDFECPACKSFVVEIDQLLEMYPENLGVVYRHFPLPIHTGAVPAAKASESAANQGMFWEYHDELFLNSPDFSFDDLKRYVETLGLNLEQFESDYNSDEVTNRVNEDLEYARGLNLSGTPTFYLVYDDTYEKVALNSFDDLGIRVSEILASQGVEIDDTGESQTGDTPSDPNETSDTPSQTAIQETIEKNIAADLSEVLGVEVTVDDLTFEFEETIWGNTSLGCPVEGMMYAEVETPGYTVTVGYNGQTFEYHTDMTGNTIVSCEE